MKIKNLMIDLSNDIIEKLEISKVIALWRRRGE